MQQMKRSAEAALTLINALAAQVDRIEQRLDELEQRPRGPGRPRSNGEHETVQR
ncbi:MAG: hypothetical protein IPO75_15805 [Betaproteobacteria bacterium]|nr:hypothetical protein [Betaproteobacteria bacterium]